MGAQPYAPLVHELARESGLDCSVQRFEIEDCSTPSRTKMLAIQDAIEAAIRARRPPYVHCWGGRGRTGTVVGVYLLRCGLATPDNFVDVLARLRSEVPGASPETDEQIAFVRSWQL
jgi:protein-tyrosine phosphatase